MRDLDLQATWTNVSSCTATPQEEQLWQIILKSMQKCRSCLAQTSSIYDHSIIWPSSVTLVLNLSEQMFQMALLVVKANKSVKLFWNPCINVGVMARTSSFYDHFIIWPSSVTLTFNQPEKYFKYHSSSSRTSYGSDKSIRMHHACTQEARTNAGTYTIKNCNSYVSLNASRLYKKESSLKGKNLLYLEQILYYEMTTIYMRSTNETDRVALPESVPIHLMIVTDITFTKQQTCIMSFE